MEYVTLTVKTNKQKKKQGFKFIEEITFIQEKKFYLDRTSQSLEGWSSYHVASLPVAN